MITFTQITLVIIIIGVLLACMPKNWYAKSTIDFRLLGFWLAGITGSILLMTWLGYLLYGLVLTLINTFKMAGF